MADGIIIIDKPAGWTSMDVCARLRGILQTKKVGHAGTLDPMATGVLPVFVGQATRAVSFAESGEKEYVAGLRLGLVTDTQDTQGRELRQLPPMYSAVKIGGRKLYEYARSGESIERSTRSVTVHELELLEQVSPTDFILRVRCSKGTYVRTLCHDIGAELGCGGCMYSLRRTRAAGFTLAESHTLEEVQEQGEALLRPVDSLFAQYPAYTLPHPRMEFLCRCGNPLRIREPLAEGIYRVYGADGAFLCLSRLESGVMTSIKNFFGA